MKPTILIITLFSLITACRFEKTTLLVEAESFNDTGGWVVDPQFVEQMGSPYLLAHGLGEPVQNAKTSVTFPANGTYYTYVRTMDWAPGNWDAPGRFNLVINGQEFNTTLGTESGWGWQYAGKIDINKTENTIELKDLTGFDGRCDAIYFSTIQKQPPNAPDTLRKWRRTQLSEGSVPAQTQEFDLVIVGGGMAGCGAAIASAEQGLQVALIHDRPVLGGNASSEIRVHTEGITWYYDRILKMINTVHYPNGSPEARKEDEKRLRNIQKYPNISLFLNWRAYITNTTGNFITSVDARHTSSGETRRFLAPLFVDCTGDGWIGYWAGADYMYGREDASEFDEQLPDYGELWSPSEADNRVMGASVLWRSTMTAMPADFPEVPWAMNVAKEHSAVNGEWYWEFSRNDLHQIHHAEAIRDHLLRAIFGSFYNAKQNPEHTHLKLEWVSHLVGKRESRRLVGDYVYTFQDIKEQREFIDTVVKEERAVDIHFQQNLVDPSKPDFYSEALYYHVDHYYIPYRSLYSKNIANLFMAGRCFSSSHVGLGGPRVMHTTGQMGAAVGYAASLCHRYDVTPRDIYKNYLDELLDLIVTSNAYSP